MPRSSGDRRSIVMEVARSGRMVWRLMWDNRVPLSLKLLIPAALLYLASPVDIIPDVFATFLGVGMVDDAVVLVLAIRLLIALAPKSVVAEYERLTSGDKQVVDTAFRVLES